MTQRDLLQIATPISEAEWTATERSWRLCMAFWTHRDGPKAASFTTSEVMQMLGYSTYSGAASMLERNRLTGLYRGNDGRWRLELDWPRHTPLARACNAGD